MDDLSQLFDWAMLAPKVLWAAGGALTAMVAGYWSLGRDVAYIKGKLDQHIDHTERLEKLEGSLQQVSLEVKHLNKELFNGHANNYHNA